MLNENRIKYAPENTDGVIFSHGFSFMGEQIFGKNAVDKINSILNTRVEICVSKIEDAVNCKKLGDIGVFLKGTITLMATEDISSYITENGFREIQPWKDYESLLVKDYNDLKTTSKYCEVWMQPEEITGWWIRRNPSILDEDDIQEFIDAVGSENVTYI